MNCLRTQNQMPPSKNLFGLMALAKVTNYGICFRVLDSRSTEEPHEFSTDQIP